MIEKIIISTESGSNIVGYEFKDKDGNNIDWGNLDRADQIKVLNSFANGYELFVKFLKDE